MYNLLVTLVGFTIYVPYAYSQGFNLQNVKLFDFLILAFVASTYLFYFYIALMSQISLTGTIWACYPVTTIIFSVIFLGEKVTPTQILVSLVILFGVALIGLPEKLKDFKFERWFWLAVAASAVVGFADFLAKSVINNTALGDYFLVYAFATVPGMFMAYLIDKKGRVLPKLSVKIWFMVIVGAILLELGNVFFFTAFSFGPASLVSPVVSSYQAITVVLALIFLKEKLRKVQAVGVALAVLGIILIGV